VVEVAGAAVVLVEGRVPAALARADLRLIVAVEAALGAGGGGGRQEGEQGEDCRDAGGGHCA
jgi:hypothetical protein